MSCTGERTSGTILTPSIPRNSLANAGIRSTVSPLPLTIVLTLLVEILTSIEGIGALMIAAQRNFQSGQVYGLLVLVGMFGFFLNNAFSIVQAVILRRWPPRNVQA